MDDESKVEMSEREHAMFVALLCMADAFRELGMGKHLAARLQQGAADLREEGVGPAAVRIVEYLAGMANGPPTDRSQH